ncbi:MAG: hypothetical protein A3H28_11075 [Acidobacteria bacterium RIFCSPLOWO2_02_FULL_61_28]|nr:MAG: hypothetical protein A3H28_11075 [Acidobacteria bacterium RIFCSPLOWO2_02_FULL_61_28]
MGLPNKTYIVDDAGKRVGVLLDMDEYRRILGELEELESMRAFDAAKASKDEAVPFDQAIREIEQKRR